MKNNKNLMITIAVIVLLIIGVIGGLYYYKKSNKLTVSEKKWIDENNKSSQIINIGVVNNASVFGFNGAGVFYNFLDDFAAEYDLNINKVTYDYGQAQNIVSLGATTNLKKNDILFYTDHYVLISPEFEIISSISDISGQKVSILAGDVSYVSNYIDNSLISYESQKSIDDLLLSLKETKYAIVPLHLYLDRILTENLEIIYHFSDINMYYTLSTKDDTLSSILGKYFEMWNYNLDNYYNQNLFNLTVDFLNITETEIDAMQSVAYEYGYINNSPYEVITSGNYGGVAAVYLKGFETFASVEFNFTKYRNFNRFNKALNKKEIDVYFGYYNITNEYSKTLSGIAASYSVIANTKNDIVVNSVYSLIGKTVYVDKNSMLYTYLKTISGINIKTYDNAKELVKLNKKDEIILVDTNIYEYYKTHGLENYTLRYTGSIKYVYGFNVSTSSAMYKLLNKYMSITDPNKVLNEGIYNHEQTVSSGKILGLIAKYFIYIFALGLVVAFIVIRKTRKISIAKKIKRDDKLKFIDQLTLLKNRNYLSENIKEWSNNTIYPQAILVIDLNKLQQINDIEGYEEGDKQIKVAANILMKTQLDNTDIIRTNGNEFVVYLVGYSQKQITNYIHKLNKQFKKLPYNYGAEFGYSMILDDIKTIEDALNEAIKVLKKQKEVHEKEN